MQLKQFRISNFKCFHEPDAVELKPGFNVFTGKNSAGKSALLQALSLQFSNSPHISVHTKPTPTAPLIGTSVIEVTFQMTNEEWRNTIERPGMQFQIPLPPNLRNSGK